MASELEASGSAPVGMPASSAVDVPVSSRGTVADVEPFLQEVARQSWVAFKRDPVLYIVGSCAAGLLSLLSFGILLGPMTTGFIRIVHRGLHGQSARIGDLMEGLRAPLLVSSLFASVLIAIGTALGLLLFMLPGVFVAVATSFAFHELSYRRVTAIEAIKGSFALLRDHLLHVLLLLIAVAIINVIGQLAILGSLIAVPFSVVAMTVAYEKLSGQTTGSQITTIAS
jgi:uncharacterized membrane protein